MFVLINVIKFSKNKAYLFSDYDVFNDGLIYYDHTAWNDALL